MTRTKVITLKEVQAAEGRSRQLSDEAASALQEAQRLRGLYTAQEEAKKRAEERYICKTCLNERKSEADSIVSNDGKHTHGCPLEDGDPCSSRRCNETGMCQG